MLLALAEQLGNFTMLVGGPEYVHCLLVRHLTSEAQKNDLTETVKKKKYYEAKVHKTDLKLFCLMVCRLSNKLLELF